MKDKNPTERRPFNQPRPSHMGQPSPRARPPREKRICNVCKKEFQPKSGNHFFCSKSCQRAHSLVKLTDLDVGISALADDLARDPEAKALMMELSGVKGDPFPRGGTVNLLHGDCLERMKEIPDGSVDMVLTDPPYGTTACKWDSIIPLEPMWEQLKRVTKKNGAICLFGSEPFPSFLRISNISGYKYGWVWVKRPVNFLNAKNQPLRKTERISVFGGSNYFPQGLVAQRKINKRSNSTETNGEHGRENIAEFTNYPTDVLEFIGERGFHPTQKPVALMEYLIKTYTNEGETVLDFTMGSGTTGVACVNLNRNFIGIERDDKYFQIAVDRIEEAILGY